MHTNKKAQRTAVLMEQLYSEDMKKKSFTTCPEQITV
jgi:hypothetical protein